MHADCVSTIRDILSYTNENQLTRQRRRTIEKQSIHNQTHFKQSNLGVFDDRLGSTHVFLD